MTYLHCPGSQDQGWNPAFPSGVVVTCWGHTGGWAGSCRSSHMVQLRRPPGGLRPCVTLSQESWRSRYGAGGRMTGVHKADLLAALGTGEKVCHISVLWDPCGDAILEDRKLISPKPVHTQIPWSPGTGDIQLGGSCCCMGS